jgi:hypothetical protein
MPSLTVLTTLLLSLSMVSATAAAQTQSQSPRCTSLGQSLPQCQTIGVSAAAAGGVLNLLSKDYPIEPIEQTAASVFPSHLVIGAADLDNPQIIPLLKQSYRFGKTVAIVGATQDQADRFHRLLRPGETSNCSLPKGQETVSLYALQRSRYRFPPQNSSYCLVNLDRRDLGADRRWLRERFGLTPPQPAAGDLTSTSKFSISPRLARSANAASSDDPPQTLTSLAGATHCSSKANNSYGTIEADYYVYSMRDFTDTGCSSCKDPGADYYLVQENLSVQKTQNSIYLVGYGEQGFLQNDTTPGAPNGGFFISNAINLEFADPATTTSYVSSYTNGSSATASGSVGFNAEGPNVTLGGSTTTSSESTYTVPPTQIVNISNLPLAVPEWEFGPSNFAVGPDFQANPTWTWFIPQDAYPSGGTGSGGILFSHTSGFLQADLNVNPPVTLFVGTIEQNCTVPFPFSAWTVQTPVLSSLSTTSVSTNGGTFTITGQYLYPGSVTAVLIGGSAVPLSTNVDLSDAQTIEVTVPLGLSPGTYPVQVNTQFNGENRFSNTLSLTLTN